MLKHRNSNINNEPTKKEEINERKYKKALTTVFGI